MIVPIGPIHPALKEPIRLKLQTEGERVVKAEIEFGYVHNNPREADVLLLTGAVTEQWVDNLKRVYDKAPEPKIVVAIGNCPQSGDVFNQEGGHVHAPASDFIPVAAAIPGCPPRPSEILEAILAVGPQAIADRGREQE